MQSCIDRASVSRVDKRVHAGTKVINGVETSETNVTLFSNEEYAGIVGRSFNQETDCVAVMNGDENIVDRFPIAASYKWSDNSIIARISPGSAVTVRVNWMIVAGA